MGRLVVMKELNKFDVFLFDGLSYIWSGKCRGGIYECDSPDNAGCYLSVGEESYEILREVEVIGQMVNCRKE